MSELNAADKLKRLIRQSVKADPTLAGDVDLTELEVEPELEPSPEPVIKPKKKLIAMPKEIKERRKAAKKKAEETARLEGIKRNRIDRKAAEKSIEWNEWDRERILMALRRCPGSTAIMVHRVVKNNRLAKQVVADCLDRQVAAGVITWTPGNKGVKKYWFPADAEKYAGRIYNK